MNELKIILPYILPGLNGPEGLIRGHWAARKKRLESIVWDIKQQVRAGIGFDTSVSVTYSGYCHKLKDWDNFCASFKLIGDALQLCGIIKNDSPEFLNPFNPRQHKIPMKEKQFTEILIVRNNHTR